MDDHGDRRPSPEALLTLAAKERRGKLKIFIGASPGVGKTYAMLTGAQRLKAEGHDAIIGIVETHGRAETAALLNGLEVLPRKSITYRGHDLMEFDLDAALLRKPRLIVVDELAHSNAPGSRHPKRYQDVEELLDAGIDVWTALNIQHIESLSDVVATITGIKVRELVPDTVLENAADVILVDLTPDELIQRLKEGKVYLPDNARRAADNFLQLGNLTALRELALRRTAQRVDDQMVDYLRQNAIEGPWPTHDRILVCVGSNDGSEQVVRQAARMANALNATWVAVHASSSAEVTLDPELQRKIDSNLELASRLGGDVTRISAKDLPDEVLRFAAQENITQIVIGRSRPGVLKRLMGRSLSDEIVHRARGVSVHVLTESLHGPLPATRFRIPRISLSGIALAPTAVACAVLAGIAANHYLKLPNLSMIFLAAVLVCAVTSGTTSAVLAAALSFLAYNFFFIEPLYTLTIASPHELLALIIFLLVAVMTGGLAGRVREQSLASASRVKLVEGLFDLSRKLSTSSKLDDLLWIIATQAAATVKGETIVLLSEKDQISIKAGMPPEDHLETADWAAARWAFAHSEIAGWNSQTLPNSHFQYHPLKTPQGIVGLVGIRPKEGVIGSEMRRNLEALLDQFSIAIERVNLVGELADARASAEVEKLRSALLSSISHDLRTPLSSIVGSVTTVRSLEGKISKTVRDDLLQNIEEEANRLSRFVANLLDMTKIEGGTIQISNERLHVGDVVAAAVRRARKAWPQRTISITLPSEIAYATGDAGLLEQLVFNLLDNANKYSGPESSTKVAVFMRDTNIVLVVEDEGQGIPPEDLERVFEKFYRVKVGDGRAAGTGLGLAICRGIVKTMGGSIKAESPVHDGHGTRISVTFPIDM
ncbi:MAG: sensor histidine kinase KdpD, partial [Aestuariivirga sp.]